jgi:hypothetical protein
MKLAYYLADLCVDGSRFNCYKVLVGKDWVVGCCTRQRFAAKCRTVQVSSCSEFNKVQVQAWFANLKDCHGEKKFPPHCVSALTSSECLLLPNKDPAVVVLNRKKVKC